MMRVERADVSLTRVKLVVSANEADLTPIKRHVVAHFRHSVKVPGFRAGTAPLSMVEKHVDQKQLLDEFMEHALNGLYRQAISQENIRPVGNPDISLKKFVPFSDFQFETETDVLGAITLPDYKKIKLAKAPVDVTAKEVNDVVKSLQLRAAKRKEVERPAKNGDEVVIDFTGKEKDGKIVSGADGKDYPLLLGSQSFIPGFEEKLVSAKAGESRTFETKFPKDYGVAALQGKDITFDVTVKKVNELDEPKADDKFAAQVGPFKTLAELKADIKKNLKLEKEQQARNEQTNRVIAEIAANTKVEIPDSMIEEEISRLEDEEKRNLVYRGTTWQEHLKEEGITEAQHRQRHKPQATERLKVGLILGEIAEKEGITVTEQEVDERIKLLKGQYQDAAMQAELDKPQARRDIEARLMTEKTLAKLVEYTGS